MEYTISIDCGGTFTDGLLTSGKEAVGAKVLTTPYDLTVCFAEILGELARRKGLTLEELLASCSIMVEVEYLPPGHPLTEDILLDIDKMVEKYGRKERDA